MGAEVEVVVVVVVVVVVGGCGRVVAPKVLLYNSVTTALQASSIAAQVFSSPTPRATTFSQNPFIHSSLYINSAVVGRCKIAMTAGSSGEVSPVGRSKMAVKRDLVGRWR